MNWEIKIFDTNDKKMWYYLLEKIRNKDIHFTPEYIESFEKIFGKGYLFFYGDKENYIIYPFFMREINKLPFFELIYSNEKYYDITSPWYFGGPLKFSSDGKKDLSLFNDFLSELHTYYMENNVVAEFCRFHPTLKNHIPLIDVEKDNVERVYEVAYIDLKQSQDIIWKNIKKSCRYAISAAKKKNVKIVWSQRKEYLKIFYDMYILTMQRIGASKFYFFEYSFLENLYNRLKDNMVIFIATFEERPIASSLFLYKYGIMHYWLSGSDSNYWNLYPNNLLIYKAILWAKEHGNNLFLLMGGSSPSLRRFKNSFTRTTTDFYIYKKVHNDEVYKLLCDKKLEYVKKNRITTFNSDYFPMYRGGE